MGACANKMIRFSEFLKDYRKKNGLSIRDIADMIFCEENTVQGWEKGIHIPQKHYHKDIEDAFGKEAVKDVLEFHIAEWLLDVMKRHGLNKTKFAELSGISRAEICYITLGEKSIREKTLEKLIRICGELDS